MSKRKECEFSFPVPRDAGHYGKHQDLIVRVSGLRARFVDIDHRPAHRVRHQGEPSS